MSETHPTRREVMHKAVYMTPAILSLPVLLSFASAGSGKDDDKDKEKKKEKKKEK